ncbi:hypothetical protein PTI98_012270 [Pleurotus ostreatus]|nr:hypothetical protein PTI98_012270 [Pleurotus ostreatus]
MNLHGLDSTNTIHIQLMCTSLLIKHGRATKMSPELVHPSHFIIAIVSSTSSNSYVRVSKAPNDVRDLTRETVHSRPSPTTLPFTAIIVSIFYLTPSICACNHSLYCSRFAEVSCPLLPTHHLRCFLSSVCLAQIAENPCRRFEHAQSEAFAASGQISDVTKEKV